jgi:hypothetical protein
MSKNPEGGVNRREALITAGTTAQAQVPENARQGQTIKAPDRFSTVPLGIPWKKIGPLCGLAGLLGLSNCATTQETVQECKKAAYSFCEKTAGPKGAGGGGPGAGDAAARNAVYLSCLDTQLAACGAP